MNRIILSAITFTACGLQAVPTEQNIVAQLKKAIVAANVTSFETAFNAHTVTTQEKEDLATIARVTRSKLHAECEAMGNSTGNAKTFLTGLGQGTVGLWALFNTFVTGFVAVATRGKNVDLIKLHGAFLIPSVRLPFCFTQGENKYYSYMNDKIEFNPDLDQQLPRLWAGCALTGIPFGALTAYSFYKAAVNVSRGLNYKKYLQTQIANLDVIIEYLV